MPSVEMFHVEVEVVMQNGTVRRVTAYFDGPPTLDEFLDSHEEGRKGMEGWVAGLHAAAAVIVARGLPPSPVDFPPNTAATFQYPDGSVTVTRTCRWVSETEVK